MTGPMETLAGPMPMTSGLVSIYISSLEDLEREP